MKTVSITKAIVEPIIGVVGLSYLSLGRKVNGESINARQLVSIYYPLFQSLQTKANARLSIRVMT